MEQRTINPVVGLFQSSNHIQQLICRADDYDETKKLISKYAELKKTRSPFYLTSADFNDILKWKLRQQYNRQYRNRERNTEHNINIVTQAAFAVEHQDRDYETELRLKILTTLSGVEVPVASAILTLCYPELYSVIDFRGWRQIFGNAKTYANYTPKEYIKYLTIIRHAAKIFQFTTQEMDMAIWQYDIEFNRKK